MSAELGGRARDHLAEIAALADERRAAAERSWATARDAERRLLAARDALLAIEPRAVIQSAVVDHSREVTSPDPGRAFAAAFALGCLDGEAAVAETATGLTLAHPDTQVAFREALGLASHDGVGPALLRRLPGAAPQLAVVALEALRFRREAEFAPCVVLLGHPAPAVSAAAARALGSVPERGPAAAVLARALAEGRGDACALVVAEALLSLAAAAPAAAAAAVAFARRKLEAEIASPALADDARVGYLRLLALAGEAADLELFWRSLEALPRDAVAVGWFGHADLVDWLLASLETANEARHAGEGRALPFELAAAEALERITGARRRGEVEAGPGGALTPPLDASTWRPFWKAARARFAGGLRYRFGEPYRPEATVVELEGDAPPAARREAATELAIVTAGAVRMDTRDWVDRQEASLAEARRWLADGAADRAAGAFPGTRGS